MLGVLQVGFVMCLEAQRLSAALEDYLPDYEFAFEGNGSELGGMYYHTDRTRQLNAHFGDMLHKIQDLEVSSLFVSIHSSYCDMYSCRLSAFVLSGSYKQHTRLRCSKTCANIAGSSNTFKSLPGALDCLHPKLSYPGRNLSGHQQGPPTEHVKHLADAI